MIRGGLAGLPKGQQGGGCLGARLLAGAAAHHPAAGLKISIPGIVNVFIGLFKDTTLVSFVSLMDPLRGVTAIVRADIDWKAAYWEPISSSPPSSSSPAGMTATRSISKPGSRPIIAEVPMTQAAMKISDDVAIHISGMNKWYGTFHVLRDVNLTVQRGEAHRDLRAFGVREIDADPLHQPSGGTPVGPDRRGWHRTDQ